MFAQWNQVIAPTLNYDASVSMFDAPNSFPSHLDFESCIMDDLMYAKWLNNFAMKSHYPKCYAQMTIFE